VGFISDLPTQLVAAFRATLEEVIEADVLLHVRDISHPDTEAQKKDVNAVLTELGVALEAQENMIEVWNKVDLLAEEDRTMLAGRSTAAKQSAVSAITGEGIDALLERIDRALSRNFVDATLSLDATDGAGLAWAYANGDVIRRQDAEDGSVSLELSLPMRAMPGFERRFGDRLARKSA
jgi:GTP-binding protein HflX